MNAPAHIPTREDIERLQASMLSMPQLDLETQHYFAQGLYCRVLPRLAGTLIVGKVHKQEHLYIVCCGTVRVVSDAETKDVTGPAVIVSAPGTKRAVLALTDATCLTVHHTHLNDLEAIEEELIEPDETALFDAHNRLKQELLK